MKKQSKKKIETISDLAEMIQRAIGKDVEVIKKDVGEIKEKMVTKEKIKAVLKEVHRVDRYCFILCCNFSVLERMERTQERYG